MQNNAMKIWLESFYLSGDNKSYIEQIYKDFLIDPNSVSSSWHMIFNQLNCLEFNQNQLNPKINKNLQKQTYDIAKTNDVSFVLKQIKVQQLVDSFRCYGHQQANLDPLGLWKRANVPDLDPAYYELTKNDFQEIFNVSYLANEFNTMKFSDLYNSLKQIYCGNIGIEYMHMTDFKERKWIQQNIEHVVKKINLSNKEKKRCLSELIAAEKIEFYLGNKFPGAKRFSLEGSEVLIPMLKEIVRSAGKDNVQEIVIGMAHRGRLNVLINILGKKPQDIFNEFLGKQKERLGTGDVKYHQGFSADIETENGPMHLSLSFNPSHLEIISPVVMGSTRARIDQMNKKDSNDILSITLHGDAAIMGQGIVQETLNMSKVHAYDVGGTLRIVINNQIGFTNSSIYDSRSAQYCTDIAKMIQVPIFHVNADDLESVIFITRLALDFRNTFKRDVIIDLVCYRRHGHNEADEPSVTQPIMYKKIKKHPSPRKIYADFLEKNGVINSCYVTKISNLFDNILDNGECMLKDWQSIKKRFSIWQNYLNFDCSENFSKKLENQYLQKLAQKISEIPQNIEMHPLVAKIYQDRIAMAYGTKHFDWGGSEMLAYATLLDDGIAIRLSGEDTKRGTFFHRHAVIYDQQNGSTYIPLTHIRKNQGIFNIWNSVLSEEATLAFEYGYATSAPQTLVIWEAQFGDFANGAQIVIDQFISSSEQKWGRMCGLVMLLPHGYEGQGPEHSSARLERYLQLCAEQNMQVCVPSTPAQIFHIIRRQAFCKIRRPLIIISPKSLLRHPLAISSIKEFVDGAFQHIIKDVDQFDPQKIKRVVICSGKVYYDLLQCRRKNNQQDLAIIRIEQLYPFPLQSIKDALIPYKHVQDFVWCQEEPKNQGAWCYIQYHLHNIIPAKATISYIGRSSSASPAVGDLVVHQTQQKKLVNDALNTN